MELTFDLKCALSRIFATANWGKIPHTGLLVMDDECKIGWRVVDKSKSKVIFNQDYGSFSSPNKPVYKMVVIGDEVHWYNIAVLPPQKLDSQPADYTTLLPSSESTIDHFRNTTTGAVNGNAFIHEIDLQSILSNYASVNSENIRVAAAKVGVPGDLFSNSNYDLLISGSVYQLTNLTNENHQIIWYIELFEQ